MFSAIATFTILFVTGLVLILFWKQLFKFKPEPPDSYISQIKRPLYRKILEDKFSFYNKLSHISKEEFLNRVIHFIETKNFYGKEGLEIDDEIKVLVAASAIQLTFGLKNYLLPFYEVINVFPKEFYSRLYKKYFYGATTENGSVSLAWEQFKKGYENETDKLNLGLHEMAHALWLNLIKGDVFDEHFAQNLDMFVEQSSQEFERMQNGGDSFLRKYGATNIEEFFSVCCEHFFEAPAEFRQNLPVVYDALSELLNLDMRNERGDFKRKNDFRPSEYDYGFFTRYFDKKYYASLKYYKWHWAYSILLYGIFAGIIFLIIISGSTNIHASQCFKGIMILSVLGLLQVRHLLLSKVMELRFYLFYCVFGVGVNGMVLFLSLNFLLARPLINYTYVKDERNREEIVFYLRNENDTTVIERVSADYSYAPAYYSKGMPLGKVLAKGCFGFDVYYE